MKQQSDTPTRLLMASATQRFRFVVRFAALDFDGFRAGDWSNLREDVRDFLLPTHADLQPGGLHTWPTEAPLPEEYAPEDFRALQAEVRELLALVVASRASNQVWPYKPIQVCGAAPHVPSLPSAQPGRHFVSLQGATRDLFLLRILVLLGQVNTSGLRRCPECDAIFLRNRNQAYCSRRCINRVTQRRWRERQDAGETTSFVSDVVH